MVNLLFAYLIVAVCRHENAVKEIDDALRKCKEKDKRARAKAQQEQRELEAKRAELMGRLGGLDRSGYNNGYLAAKRVCGALSDLGR